jgi:hypothetical protein
LIHQRRDARKPRQTIAFVEALLRDAQVQQRPPVSIGSNDAHP